jgi:hypothetical protein
MLRKSPERYNGNVIAAAPGTHQAAVRMVAKYCKPSDAILDLGAYTGALIERLRDSGFPNTTAADLDNHLTVKAVWIWIRIAYLQQNVPAISTAMGRRFPPDGMVHRGGHRLGHRHQKLNDIACNARELICQSRLANPPNKRAPLTDVKRVVVERGRQGNRRRGGHAGLTTLKCVTDCLTQAMTGKSQGP